MSPPTLAAPLPPLRGQLALDTLLELDGQTGRVAGFREGSGELPLQVVVEFDDGQERVVALAEAAAGVPVPFDEGVDRSFQLHSLASLHKAFPEDRRAIEKALGMLAIVKLVEQPELPELKAVGKDARVEYVVQNLAAANGSGSRTRTVYEWCARWRDAGEIGLLDRRVRDKLTGPANALRSLHPRVQNMIVAVVQELRPQSDHDKLNVAAQVLARLKREGLDLRDPDTVPPLDDPPDTPGLARKQQQSLARTTLYRAVVLAMQEAGMNRTARQRQSDMNSPVLNGSPVAAHRIFGRVEVDCWEADHFVVLDGQKIRPWFVLVVCLFARRVVMRACRGRPTSLDAALLLFKLVSPHVIGPLTHAPTAGAFGFPREVLAERVLPGMLPGAVVPDNGAEFQGAFYDAAARLHSMLMYTGVGHPTGKPHVESLARTFAKLVQDIDGYVGGSTEHRARHPELDPDLMSWTDFVRLMDARYELEYHAVPHPDLRRDGMPDQLMTPNQKLLAGFEAGLCVEVLVNPLDVFALLPHEWVQVTQHGAVTSWGAFGHDRIQRFARHQKGGAAAPLADRGRKIQVFHWDELPDVAFWRDPDSHTWYALDKIGRRGPQPMRLLMRAAEQLILGDTPAPGRARTSFERMESLSNAIVHQDQLLAAAEHRDNVRREALHRVHAHHARRHHQEAPSGDPTAASNERRGEDLIDFAEPEQGW